MAECLSRHSPVGTDRLDLYLTDICVDQLCPAKQESILTLLRQRWRTIILAGHFARQPLGRADVSVLARKHRAFLSEVNAVTNGRLVLLWDKTDSVSRNTVSMLFPRATVVVNRFVDVMIDHAERYDNKPQQRVLWWANSVFFVHWCFERMESVGSRLLANIKQREVTHPDLEEFVIARYKNYQTIASELASENFHRTRQCVFLSLSSFPRGVDDSFLPTRFGPIARMKSLLRARQVLILRMDAIGDVVHVLPALNAVRKALAHAEITFVVGNRAKEVVEGHPAVDRLVVYPGRRKIGWQSTGQTSRGVSVLRERCYDLVIDFHGLFRNHALIAWSAALGCIGFERPNGHPLTRPLLNTRVRPIGINEHPVTKCLKFLAEIGIKTGEIEYKLPVTEQHRLTAKRVLRRSVSRSAQWVAIAPGASWETKRWNVERYARLADRLIARLGVDIVFTGAEGEATWNRRILQMMKASALDVTGKLSLMDAAALYERVDLLVTGDTGPGHLAAAVSTPVVAIFGPTPPWRFRPHGPGHKVLWAGLGCSPCFKHRFAECDYSMECMRAISEDAVFWEVEAALATKSVE